MNSKINHMCLFSWISSIILGAYSCTLPAYWDGDYHDSSDTTRDITFTRSSSNVVGWGLMVYSSAISSWTCVDEDTSNNLLLFQSNQKADVFGAPHNVYRCIKWEKLTDYSYSYLIYANIESNAQNKRVFVLPNTTVVDTSSGCNPSNGLPFAIETAVLIKKGYIANATQNCPSPFLGSFNYSFSDGSTTYCDGTSVWGVCSDRTQMVVNYTLCSTTQFYSNGGVAYCAFSTSVGSNYYVTVVNADSTVDFGGTFRFTCYAVKSSGGLVYASDNKGMCLPNQDPQTKSATGTGTLTFSAFKTCPFILDTTTETSSDNIGLIAGSVTGVVLLVAAAVVAGILIHKKYQHNQIQSNAEIH
ncbi:uncharacterized protein LOC128156563 [Crassostrea angulata]|uniref:uncharacterized protein LOC128156563 n=1 Tax=Magallana angulata TaxID=2784310 RepID=UPI0022B20DD8|nr:uncharacterized protein LOC128156563 [Crassostrea angulata]